MVVETLKTVNIEDDEIVPHSDYVTIGLVGKNSWVIEYYDMPPSTDNCSISLLTIYDTFCNN